MGRFAKMAHTQGGRNNADGKKGEVEVMREVLTNHLQMMKSIMVIPSVDSPSATVNRAILRSKGELVRDARLQLLILHLPAIRYNLRTDCNSS